MAGGTLSTPYHDYLNARWRVFVSLSGHWGRVKEVGLSFSYPEMSNNGCGDSVFIDPFIASVKFDSLRQPFAFICGKRALAEKRDRRASIESTRPYIEKISQNKRINRRTVGKSIVPYVFQAAWERNIGQGATAIKCRVFNFVQIARKLNRGK